MHNQPVMPDPASSALGVALVGGEELSDEQIMAQLRQEFLRQLASQRPAALYLGQLTYSDAAGYSAFANFLDDFSGPSGRAQKDFGATIFYPDQFHQTYFFQDTWLPAPSDLLTWWKLG